MRKPKGFRAQPVKEQVHWHKEWIEKNYRQSVPKTTSADIIHDVLYLESKRLLLRPVSLRKKLVHFVLHKLKWCKCYRPIRGISYIRK